VGSMGDAHSSSQVLGGMQMSARTLQLLPVVVAWALNSDALEQGLQTKEGGERALPANSVLGGWHVSSAESGAHVLVPERVPHVECCQCVV
jgi:hypothetical protein